MNDEAVKDISVDNIPGNARKEPGKSWTGFPTVMKRFCRFILGLVFVVSGLLKLLDPVGAGLVMSEYYSFFHLDFLDFSAKFIGVSFAFVETVAGAALVSGVFRRLSAYIVSAFLAFFTLLTLILVIFNPEMDCGCFGEAVHLTHIQTFVKNIILCVIGLVAFLPYNYFGRPKKRKYVAFALVGLAVLFFMVYSLVYIPMMDFTAFKPGVKLMSATEYSEDAFKAAFIYEKDGVTESFSLDNLPDSTWTFVSTETEKVLQVDEMPVLSIYDVNGSYCDTIFNKGAVIAVSVYNPENIGEKKWRNISDFFVRASAIGFSTVLLVASSDMEDVPKEIYESGDLYFADYKTLITLNRSNGGATYFFNANLVRKWGYSNLPSEDDLYGEIAKDAMETVLSSSTTGSLVFQAFLLYIFAVMLLL